MSNNDFSAVLSTERRVGGLCWEHLKPKGPKGNPRYRFTEILVEQQSPQGDLV